MTGIVRRIDELGRIVIPKEIRNVLNIYPGDNLEILIESTNILLKKYSYIDNNYNYLKLCVEELQKSIDKKVILSTRDKTLYNNEINIDDFKTNLKLVYEERKEIISTEKKLIKKDDNSITEVYYAIFPINLMGDVKGCIIIYDESILSENDISSARLTVNIINKYLSN